MFIKSRRKTSDMSLPSTSFPTGLYEALLSVWRYVIDSYGEEEGGGMMSQKKRKRNHCPMGERERKKTRARGVDV